SHRKGGSWWVAKTSQKPASLPEVQNGSARATLTRRGASWLHSDLPGKTNHRDLGKNSRH
ncbi:unnamed protein product, partial [Gulo gulo]